MLKTNFMELVSNCTYTETLELFNSGNGQSVREALIRQAVQYCDNYATDILILLEGTSLKIMFANENYEIDIYYRNNGVNWVGAFDEDHCGEVPKLYRACAKLVKEGRHVTLYKGSGNC